MDERIEVAEIDPGKGTPDREPLPFEPSRGAGHAPDGPLAGVLNALTFRVLAPVRRIVPPLGGSLDLSPLIVIVLAQLVLILPVAMLEQAIAELFR